MFSSVSVKIAVLLFLNMFLKTNLERVERGAVGGLIAEFDEFPFMSALGWKNNMTEEVDFLCGGMLIAPNFVLTAAHCVFYKGQLPDIIKIGGNMLNGTDNEDHKVKMSFIFPKYKSKFGYDDIAMLQLEDDSKKSPASLWIEENPENMRVIAIGYGTTQYSGSRTDILQKVKLTVTKNEECSTFFKTERKFPTGISDSHICAGDPEGKQDTCQGDSGGPLLVLKKFAAGIISSGQACSGVPPAIYTKIAAYVDWIDSILIENSEYKLITSTSIDTNTTSYS